MSKPEEVNHTENFTVEEIGEIVAIITYPEQLQILKQLKSTTVNTNPEDQERIAIKIAGDNFVYGV